VLKPLIERSWCRDRCRPLTVLEIVELDDCCIVVALPPRPLLAIRVAVFSDSCPADQAPGAVHIDAVEGLGPRHDRETIDQPARAAIAEVAPPLACFPPRT
jgi:hypothetical protein